MFHHVIIVISQTSETFTTRFVPIPEIAQLHVITSLEPVPPA